jgi:ketosteroid isomerase-like protein
MKFPSALFRYLFLLVACTGFGSVGGAATPQADEIAIRRDLSRLEAELQAADPTAWVYCYSEDAMFVGPGDRPVQGRAALLEMAKAMTPLRELKIIPQRIESSGALAYAYIRGHWSNGQPGATPTRVRSLLVLRREADGHWRVVQELMQVDPDAADAVVGATKDTK